MTYCGVANRVPFQGFFYNSLPVIQGKFTLRQALEEHLVTKINDATILDTEIDTLEHVPCSALYVLAFGDHELFIVRGTNRIDELFIHDKLIPLEQKSVVPQKLLDGIRIRASNGLICDKDGIIA
jgi:hypothetical protein